MIPRIHDQTGPKNAGIEGSSKLQIEYTAAKKTNALPPPLSCVDASPPPFPAGGDPG